MTISEFKVAVADPGGAQVVIALDAKDVIPAIGAELLAEVTPDDILAITDWIKHRGADQMALQTRNVLKRLFAYAIARQKTQFNTAAAIEAKFIAQARSRDVALTAEEIGKLMRAIYQSSMKRSHKLALHLLILCMVRKSELIEARWEEIDFERAEWVIPGEQFGMGLPQPRRFETTDCEEHAEHRGAGLGSRRARLRHSRFPAHSLHVPPRARLQFGLDRKGPRPRATRSRGVYNRAEYLVQRRQMLQWWADFVDSQIQDGRGKVIIDSSGKAYQSVA